MSKLKNKAFTLIELLAIIVILAIIAVITVPIILNIIDNSRKGAAVNSAYGFVDAINKKYLLSSIEGQNKNINGTYQIIDGKIMNGSYSNEEIEVNGQKPTAGILTYENNKLQSGCLVIDEYEVRYQDGSFSTTGKGNCSDLVEDTSNNEPINYPITFNVDGGSSISGQTIESGQTATEPPTPTKEGYTFGGWYLDSEFTQLYDFNTPITGETTLYAKWIENAKPTYTVTFNTNGGNDISSQTIESGQTATKPTNPTKEGNMFLGWYADSELTEKFNFSTSIINNTNLYAYWVPITTKSDGLNYLDATWVLNNPIYYNPTTPSESCNSDNSTSTQGVTTGCLRWYAYSFKDGVVNMILDHNINPTNVGVEWISETDFDDSDSSYGVTGMCGSEYSWVSDGVNCRGPLTALRRLKSYTSNWNTSVTGDYSTYRGVATNGGANYTIDYTSTYGYKARLISIKEVAFISNLSSWSNSNNSSISSLPAFLTYGLVNNKNTNVGDFQYWTGSPENHGSKYAYVVYNNTAQGAIASTSRGGIRPVITISTSEAFNN